MEFQSTRPRGARQRDYRKSSGTIHSFNPRARVGRDVVPHFLFVMLASFNPRARVGRDPLKVWARMGEIAFQSTRPRGARR